MITERLIENRYKISAITNVTKVAILTSTKVSKELSNKNYIQPSIKNISTIIET